MSETKKNTLTIDEVEHDIDTMTEEQKMMVNHVTDLDRKIGNSQFNLDQLLFGKQAFVTALKESLEKEPEAEFEEVENNIE